jgi:2-oxoglutarate dehydrogenase E1 component
MRLPESLNADYIEAQYHQWKNEPDSVSKDWRYFFQGFEMASVEGMALTVDKGRSPHARQANVESMIYEYRNIGHMLACMDPLSACPTEHPLLSLEAFGLNADDLNREFAAADFFKAGRAKLKDILAGLKEIYCRSIGVEYMHIQDPEERKWLQKRMEPVGNRPDLDKAEKIRILKRLIQASLFEKFLNKKYMGVTRFSLEGGDAVIPLMDTLVRQSLVHGCREIMLGMAHRGRLNVQCHILGKSYEEVFREFESCYDAGQLMGSGDVKYHKGFLSEVEVDTGKIMRMFLVNNPSHLEAVDPVVEGIARARQDNGGIGQNAVLPVLVHGDAAFAGQGIVAETLNMSQLEGYATGGTVHMSQLEGYATGGTVHIIINNQIGYTTLPEDARSTRYSTDVAKMLMIPIFHVHGENPEAVVHVARLAVDYRNRFHKDVVIDVVCYRRYGHNEGDDPYFTQPLMYERIRERPSPYKLYAETLLDQKLVDKARLETMEKEVTNALENAFEDIHGTDCLFPESAYFEEWAGVQGLYTHGVMNTGLSKKAIVDLAKKLNALPEGFALNPKLKRLLKKRLQTVADGRGIDWANAEAMAFGSLLTEGFPIRLSGQDVGRGTFSQRHSVLHDTNTGDRFIPLNHLNAAQAKISVYNSLLAEASVLGFDYGYSMIQPQTLVLWEAQFGDFSNSAQTIIDLFITSGQSKWDRLSGITLLLPHGWEGLGPEHSSARLERFLQLCAGENIQVCNLTTPAQYFHILRRQMKAPYRKPLIIMTPKSLLRLPRAVSSLEDFVSGRYDPVLDDPDPVKGVKRVIICSGKIFYQLAARRDEIRNKHTAIIRLEQFYPFPRAQLDIVLKKYSPAKTWMWVQEEPENMGGWQFVKPYLESLTGKTFQYVGRKPASSPATGFPAIYREEQETISREAIG